MMTETDTNSPSVDVLAAQWARLGAMFNVAPAEQTPELEMLLLDTARAMPASSRLLVLPATWLSRYWAAVGKKWLATCVRAMLEVEYRPNLGLLLESVTQLMPSRHRHFFAEAIAACEPAEDDMPLFLVDRASPAVARLARMQASPLSRKWGRWADPFEPKDDALRPARWVAQRNPALRVRRAYRGGVATSILAAAGQAGGAFVSESAMAKACGISRPALRDALGELEIDGLVSRRPAGKSTHIEIAAV